MLHQELQQLLYKSYKRTHGPWLRDSENIIDKGVNCQLLIHLLYKRRFGIDLPKGLWSKELYEDTHLFEEVLREERLWEADIFVFGRDELNSDPKTFHPAYFTGKYGDLGEPFLIHATFYEGVVVWPLTSFAEYKRYRKLYTVKRLRSDLHKTLIRPTLFS